MPLAPDMQSYPATDFGLYQAQSSQDQHSRVAQPLFTDPAAGNYRQRDNASCPDAGIQVDIHPSTNEEPANR